jgi:catechol 2,3-dioxygenase
MTSPDRYSNPPFRITRMSHVRMTVADLDASCAFYEALAGFRVSHRDDAAAHLRGVEESAHHSLVLRRAGGAPSCDAIGFRVFEDRDLDAARAWFDARGEATEWLDRTGQGRTLLVRHASGIPFELVASMQLMPRALTDYPSHQGGRALRLDHVQAIVPDVGATGDRFLDLGFRASEAILQPDGRRIGLFLHRKNNPHDLVLAMGAGPRLHHFAFVTPDLQSMFRACDTAGSLGFGPEVERGPGRHGPGNSAFVYFRDPDGHRLELILPPMQYMDAEEETRTWSAAEKHQIVPWGAPAPQRWREEATPFTACRCRPMATSRAGSRPEEEGEHDRRTAPQPRDRHRPCRHDAEAGPGPRTSRRRPRLGSDALQGLDPRSGDRRGHRRGAAIAKFCGDFLHMEAYGINMACVCW